MAGKEPSLRRFLTRLHGRSLLKSILIRGHLKAFKVYPTGSWGAFLLGHEVAVGGRWDEMGPLQFSFMCKMGEESMSCWKSAAVHCAVVDTTSSIWSRGTTSALMHREP